MKTKQRQKQLKLLESVEDREAFLQDCKVLASISKKQRNDIRAFFVGRKDPHAELDETETEKLVSEAQVSPFDLRDIVRFTRFILEQLALEKCSLEDIKEDLVALECTPDVIQSVTDYVRTILSARPNLSREARETAAANGTVETLRAIGFSLDIRAVYKNKNELLPEGLVPILMVRIQLDGARDRREFVFQLSADKLDQLCEMLTEQRSRMTELRQKVSLSSSN